MTAAPWKLYESPKENSVVCKFTQNTSKRQMYVKITLRGLGQNNCSEEVNWNIGVENCSCASENCTYLNWTMCNSTDTSVKMEISIIRGFFRCHETYIRCSSFHPPYMGSRYLRLLGEGNILPFCHSIQLKFASAFVQCFTQFVQSMEIFYFDKKKLYYHD